MTTQAPTRLKRKVSDMEQAQTIAAHAIVTKDPYPSRVAAKPVWIDRVDPVVRTRWSAKAPITQDQQTAFERDGFAVFPEVFKPDEIAALQNELAALRGDQSSLEAETIIREPGGDAIRSIFAIHRQSKLFNRLATDARLVEIARHILADDVYIHQSRLNYKPGFTGKEFYWHSDFETWHVEDGMPAMRAISVSILLTENRAENGPLMLMPGSHRHFIACVGETPEDHYRKSLRKQEYGVPDQDSLTRLASNGIAAPIGPAGSVVIFDCNTMHGSNGNITPLPRANAFLVYNALSNAFLDPYGTPRPRPEFIATRRTVTPIRPTSGLLTSGEHAA
jgi:ectoine hydroxylase